MIIIENIFRLFSWVTFILYMYFIIYLNIYTILMKVLPQIRYNLFYILTVKMFLYNIPLYLESNSIHK